MHFFKKKEPMTQSIDKVLHQDCNQIQFSIGKKKSAEVPKLVDFSYEIKPLEAEYFYNRESKTFKHDANKIAYSTNIPISAHQHAVIFFKFDSTDLPEMSETINRKTQCIFREFKPSTHNDHKEDYRFKRNIIESEYTVAGLPLRDYLKLQTHLPAVVAFLKVYEGTPCHRDTELPEDTIYISQKMT